MKENILIDKSILFAARIVKLNQYLIKIKKETIISKQIVRSGTSIGANINEANYGQSKADFISKMHIALKETAETEYWIKLLYKSEYIDEKSSISLLTDCLELKRILIASINTANQKITPDSYLSFFIQSLVRVTFLFVLFIFHYSSFIIHSCINRVNRIHIPYNRTCRLSRRVILSKYLLISDIILYSLSCREQSVSECRRTDIQRLLYFLVGKIKAIFQIHCIAHTLRQ